MTDATATPRGQITMQDGKIKRVPPEQLGSAALAAKVQANMGPSVRVTETVQVPSEPEAPRPDPTQMHWRPLTTPRRVTFLGTSFKAVSAALAEVFGPAPWRLRQQDRDALRAMAAVAGEGREPYDQIADALGKHGDIEVGVE